MTGLSRAVALKECNAFLDGVLFRERCNWLNAPTLLTVASNKPYQLALAERLGLPVPPYVITNDIQELRRFQKRHGAVVVKSLATAYITYGARSLKFYTRRLQSLDEGVLAGLRLSPVICQREIARAKEVRVTVVDGRCFSVAMDCRDLPRNVVDIRQLDYQRERRRFAPICEVPEIEAWSKSFVQALGLNYAGLDWAVTTSGRPFLFEANPLASFKWFEMVGAGNITGAIAAALLRRAGEDDRNSGLSNA